MAQNLRGNIDLPQPYPESNKDAYGHTQAWIEDAGTKKYSNNTSTSPHPALVGSAYEQVHAIDADSTIPSSLLLGLYYPSHGGGYSFLPDLQIPQSTQPIPDRPTVVRTKSTRPNLKKNRGRYGLKSTDARVEIAFISVSKTGENIGVNAQDALNRNAMLKEGTTLVSMGTTSTTITAHIELDHPGLGTWKGPLGIGKQKDQDGLTVLSRTELARLIATRLKSTLDGKGPETPRKGFVLNPFPPGTQLSQIMIEGLQRVSKGLYQLKLAVVLN